MALGMQVVTFVTVLAITLCEVFTENEFLITINKSINNGIIISLIEIGS